jgi:hypothetical protein
VATLLDSTFPTASRLVSAFEELGILVEITGQNRSRVFRYEPYLALFADTTQPWRVASTGRLRLSG